jgi:hypothetical protein
VAADLTEAIAARAQANSGLQGLLGTSPMRFYPVHVEKATKPFVIYERVSDVRLNAGGGYAGITRTRVVFSSAAATHLAAMTLDRAVRDAFNAYTGASVTAGADTVVILSMEPQNVREDYEGATQTFWVTRDILFQWRDNA